MSNSSGPKTPTKGNGESPRLFVKPADLFKMRRRSSTANNVNINNNNTNSMSSPLGFGSRSVNMNQHINNNSSNSNSFSTPNKNLATGSRFSSPGKHKIEEQSPLKCLNNIDPSPVKKLPVLLRNPFNQPVKRRLNLGSSPRKDASSRSPSKRSRIVEIDEDANLEPPKMREAKLARKEQTNGPCDSNDWTLRTKLRITFRAECKNWDDNTTSIHRRRTGTAVEESPSKLNDKSISVEAIKNAATVYQHPYLSWQSMFPRITLEFNKKKDSCFSLTKHSQVTKMMHKDWCESFDDLVNLLIGGQCSFFYMCSDNYNILFRQTPTSNRKRPLVQAYISPFYYGMGSELTKLNVEFKCPEIVRSNSSNALSNMAKECSQASFGSTRNSVMMDEESSQGIRQNSSKVAPSVDSGNASDLEDDFGEDENDTSQILESIGLSQHEFPTTLMKPKGFAGAESNTQTKSTNKKNLAVIEGIDNIRKLVTFLQNNRLYTISNVGRFACIPPTLLSPLQFRLSTPQYPEVVVSKKMIEPQPIKKQKLDDKLAPKSPKLNNEIKEQTYVELKGTILPNLYTELHKLLTISDNLEHTCQTTPLESSLDFKNIQFPA